MSILQQWTLTRLPPEVLYQIFYFLDVNSLISCTLTTKEFAKLINDERLWKDIYSRDYLPFLLQIPCNTQDLAFPTKKSDIQIEREYFPDPKIAISELYNIDEENINITKRPPLDWKLSYIERYQGIDLNGYWIGDYGKHGSELIKIYQNGYNLIAKKITGDENIPAGKLTWKMKLDESLMKGKGLIQLTETKFENPKLVQAYLEVIHKDYIRITWLFQDYLGHWYTVSFANVRAGCIDFDEDVMRRKINCLEIENDDQNDE